MTHHLYIKNSTVQTERKETCFPSQLQRYFIPSRTDTDKNFIVLPGFLPIFF